jgi:hypothetical protein
MPRSHSDEAWVQQLHLARRKVDDAEGGPLGWLVAFANEDPKTWPSAEVELHGLQLLAFVHPLPPQLVSGAGLRPLSHRDVLAHQRQIREKLRELVSVPFMRPVTIPTSGLRTALVRTTEPGVKPAPWGLSHHGSPLTTMLWQRVAELVLQTDRLIACKGPKCGRPFLALRKKLFCTEKCAQRWHDRRKIEAKRKGVR